jgi:hypothetical protein
MPTIEYVKHISRAWIIALDITFIAMACIVWETIQAIAMNNNFPQHLLQKLNRQIQSKSKSHMQKKERQQKNLDHVHLPQSANKKSYQSV